MQFVASESSVLVENLRAAFEGESNTCARYMKFGLEANWEGWHGVGSLFRAAAYAEQVHAGNHGRILRQLGGETDLVPEAVVVRSTVENLRAALAGELIEVNTMYPAFAEHARQCRDVAVARTFAWALEAEKTHARLFDEALAFVELKPDSWVWALRTFYVCPVCGYTAEEREAAMCRVCNCAWTRFEVVR